MDNNRFSPPPVVQPKTLSFYDAMKVLIEGKSIQRESWPNKQEFCLLADGWLCIKKEDGVHPWNINDGDLTGTDWIII